MKTIDELINDIRKLQFDDIEQMYQACLELKQLAKQQHDDHALCLAYNYMCDYFYSCKTLIEAINLANKVLALNEEKGFLDTLMQIYNLYAIAVCNQNYSLATGYYLKGLKLARRANDHLMMAKFYCNIGDVFIDLHEYDMALPYFKESLKQINRIDEKQPEMKMRRFVLLYIVLVYAKKEQLKEGFKILEENKELYSENKNDPMNQLANSLQALLLFKNHQEEKALALIDHILENDIDGFRANEVIYLVHKILLEITFALKDKQRINLIFRRVEENDFGKSGIRNQVELLERQIEYATIFQETDNLDTLYKQYYDLMKINQKENIDFCLSSVQYKIELFQEKEEKQNIVKMSRIDELTGVYNRRYFHQKYDKNKNKVKRLGVIIFDLDNFKHHNDTLGHLMGDQVLCDFAKCLQQNNQKIIPCRFGGDEFICLCVGVDEATIIRYIENVYNQFDSLRCLDITISCGYYNPKEILPQDKLISEADRYLYYVKNNGRNGYYGYSY